MNDGGAPNPTHGSGDHAAPPLPPLLRVCQLLNEAEARYLICGAHACILHGLVRTTEDVDILIEPTEDNCGRVIRAIQQRL